jgi:SAM-dependent methyltransferase
VNDVNSLVPARSDSRGGLARRIVDIATAALPGRLRTRIKLTVHRGDSCVCPLCGYRGDGWEWNGYDFPILREKRVVGSGRRRSACYQCGSSDRERLVYLYLRDHVRLFAKPSRHVLHIAPERELSTKCEEAGLARYVCGDLAGDGRRIHALDVTALPYPDASFDVVICNHVLEHVPDDATAMRELRRVMRPDGVAILQVPISANSATTDEDPSIADPREQERRFGQPDHVRLYGQDYVDRLTAAGFSVSRLRLSQAYPHHGLHRDEELFVCRA